MRTGLLHLQGLSLIQVALADSIVVPLGVGLDLELGQILFGSVLVIVMQVNHRCS